MMTSKKFFAKKFHKFSTNQEAGNQKSRDGYKFGCIESACFAEFITGLRS